MEHPKIIQGGMGVAVSDWKLARAVARNGQLGVVSGTGLNVVLSRRLQLGDPGGDVRRALERFPDVALVDRILNDHFIDGGKPEGAKFKVDRPFSLTNPPELHGLNAVANFVEVFLAKEGHEHPVGINYMAKIPLPNPSGIYGAMLAGVDYVFVGAGIPTEYPDLIDSLSRHEDVSLRVQPVGSTREDKPRFVTFSPQQLRIEDRRHIRKPKFVPIVSSHVLASTLARRADGGVDGFIIEGPTAGGHNAPPRGPAKVDDRGQPLYGPRDEVDLDKLLALGLPFWLAGSYHSPDRLDEALASGASGVQIGTPFAYCRESGVTAALKSRVRDALLAGELNVRKDPRVSPTGFPFNVVENIGLNDDGSLEEGRKCDLGFLRHVYQKSKGGIGYRCPAAAVAFVHAGGDSEETLGKRCLCNALLANIGLEQIRPEAPEQPLLTAGNDMETVRRLFERDPEFSATDVIELMTKSSQGA